MTKIKMKRHELWRHNYRQAQDLDHLLPKELSERFHDCTINNIIRNERNKLALKPASESGFMWSILITEVLEECLLRGYEYPYPINIESSRGDALEHFFDPIPDIDQVFEQYDLRSKPYLLKFGNQEHLKQALDYGRFRIAPASYYGLDEHNHARRDNELERFFKLNPRNNVFREESLGNNSAEISQALGWTSITSSIDYLLYSMCSEYSSRLFGDFNSNACLIIYDPKSFLTKFIRSVKQRLSSWHIEFSNVTYYDPIRINPNVISVQKFKPFKHTYQNEVRLICIPPKPAAKLQPIEIEIAPLRDCAVLVDLSSHPPKPVSYDPLDDPIQIYGNLNQETAMVNHLPDAARIESIMLDKTAREHKDWFFLMQYTDTDGSWHELKIPMLDGLYLLNLLNTAQEEQGLSLWNRKP